MNTNKQTETILVIVLGLVAVYWFKRINMLIPIAIILGLTSVLFPVVARGIHEGWTWLSKVMGAVSGRILLTVVYVIVLLPLSLLARSFGKITMRTKPGGGSYFTERNHTYTKEDIHHPW